MARKLNGIELVKYDDLFKTDAEREADQQERVQIVPAEQVSGDQRTGGVCGRRHQVPDHHYNFGIEYYGDSHQCIGESRC